MKKTKPKGSSFSKSSTKAGTAAYNTKNKVKIAKEALANKNKEIKQTKKTIARNIKNQRAAENKGYKHLSNVYGRNVEYYTLEKMPEQKAIKGKISQALTDRTRSASRAAGIAKRVAKKGK
jgi:hypothetical protein